MRTCQIRWTPPVSLEKSHVPYWACQGMQCTWDDRVQFHAEDPQNLLATATWYPGFVHSWWWSWWCGGGDDSECHLNGVVGGYGFLTPREFCTFSDNYGRPPDWLSWRTRVCVCVCVHLWGRGFDFKYEELPLECWFPWVYLLIPRQIQ